ncbi:MAG: 1,4-dihydroxy-2-naphthoate octaprenyltransferase [Motiliproteus sp.]|jgi:1,4-dihydroxy-2-naphthoate octaprenyltransferase
MLGLPMMIGTLLKTIRLPFLILTPVCVFLGLSVVIANKIEVDVYLLILTLLGAVLAHISVNTLNEYYDFKTGLDFKTKKTPFSGGSGALPQNPEMAVIVLAVGVLSLICTLIIGIFFVWKLGPGVIPLGVAGLVLVVVYTPWVTKNPYLCLIGPGFGFGFIMVSGAYFAMTGEHSQLSWLVGIVPFFLVNNLLLINQYPDIKADRDVGRNNMPIAYGTKIASLTYGLFVMMTIAAIIFFVFDGILPALSLIALLPMPLALFALKGAVKHGAALGNYPQFLGANVIVAVSTPALLGVSIIFG